MHKTQSQQTHVHMGKIP